MTILKTALTEVDNVSFLAHPCEWMGLSQLLVQKAAAADVSSYIFGTQLCFVYVAGSSYSPALPSLSKFRSCSSALPYLFLLTDSTSSDWKKEGREIVLLFSYKSPKCSIKIVRDV